MKMDSQPDTSSESFAMMTKREQKRRPKPKDGTVLVCGVCGDRALGYNFDAVSCESCKAFFRRNALKVKPFTCSFDGQCKLDPHTRKFCSGCRLKKCFVVGMKKEWILDSEQLVRRRQRQQSRYQQLQHGQQQQHEPTIPDIQPCSSTSGDSYYQDGVVSYSLRSVDNNCPPSSSISPSHPSHHQYPVNTQKCNPPSTSNHIQYPPHYFPPTAPVPSKIPKLQFSNESSTLSSGKAVRPPFIQSPQMEEPSSSTVSHNDMFTDFPFLDIKMEKEEGCKDDLSIPLTPYLKDCLDNLSKVYNDIFEESYKPEQASKMVNPKSGDQLYNMTEVFIRRLIRFSRQIPEFKSLTQHDQIHLLKGGIMEMFSLRSAMSFDAQNASWKFKIASKTAGSSGTSPSEGKLNPSAVKVLGSNMYKSHMTFVLEMQEICNRDRTILMLLFIIELFSPDRPMLRDRNIVTQGQERHSSWLRAYLESLHPVSKANVLFSNLMEKLLTARDLGEASCQLVMHIDVTKLEPLLLEVFDLNC